MSGTGFFGATDTGDNDNTNQDSSNSDTNNKRSSDDSSSNLYQQNSEISDEELLAEIQAEIRKEELLAEQLRQQMIANGTLANHTLLENSWKNQTTNAQQLTQFQETIISTGSEVSIVLLVILGILFVIQAIRKVYRKYKTSKELEKVDSALIYAKPIKAEGVTQLDDVADNEYPVYNTPFDFREQYEEAVRKEAKIPVLKDLLLKRAVAVIEKLQTFQRDGQGIHKNWNLDLLPKDVWDDFNSANAATKEEASLIEYENQTRKFRWPVKNGDEYSVFDRANEIFGATMQFKRMQFHQKMQQNRGNNIGPNIPSPNSFGNSMNNGFYNTKNKNKNSSKNQSNQQKKGQRHTKKLTKKQRREMEMNPNNDGYQNQTQTRRRKPRHRFGKS